MNSPGEVDPLPVITSTRPNYGEFTVPGVYMFHDKESRKTYIGSANNLSARWCKHSNELARGVHHNRELQAVYNKGSNFTLSYMLTETHEKALKVEQLLIDTHYDSGLIFNVAKNVVKPMLGTSRSAEARAKTSAFYDNEGVREAHSEMLRQSWQDETVRTNRLNGLRSQENRERMRESARKTWDDPEIRARLVAHRRSEEHRNALAERRSKPVTIDGISYPSIRAASKALGIKHGTLGWRIRNNKI